MRSHHQHSHAPVAVKLEGEFFKGVVEIIETPEGERFRATSKLEALSTIKITIHRPGGISEVHDFIGSAVKSGEFLKAKVPWGTP